MQVTGRIDPSIALYLKDDPSDPPVVKEMDKRILRAKEMAIFQAETKVWQAFLENCVDKWGEDSRVECKYLSDLVRERSAYSNANFHESKKPTLSPALPDYVENPRGTKPR